MRPARLQELTAVIMLVRHVNLWITEDLPA
jgi:hypothetical protein